MSCATFFHARLACVHFSFVLAVLCPFPLYFKACDSVVWLVRLIAENREQLTKENNRENSTFIKIVGYRAEYAAL